MTNIPKTTILARIHRLGWISGKQLKSDGRILPCNAPSCVGNTLEAELTGNIYYDPAIKMVSNPSERVEFKERSQFRMKSAHLPTLYREKRNH